MYRIQRKMLKKLFHFGSLSVQHSENLAQYKMKWLICVLCTHWNGDQIHGQEIGDPSDASDVTWVMETSEVPDIAYRRELWARMRVNDVQEPFQASLHNSTVQFGV
ncbi:MAG: hypothetical protein PVSMB2_01010 [Ktedonobacteraceae bacterium]